MIGKSFGLAFARNFQHKAFLKRCADGRKDLYLDQVETVSDLSYGENRKYNILDVVAPKGKMNEKLPLIIDMHGGGYVTCLKEINSFQSRYFASKGVKVVNINYRLMPEAGFKEVEQDLFQVFHWVEEHKETYGFDLSKVLLTGDSAGGHFVLLAAFILNSPELAELYGVNLPSYRIKVAANCPAGSTKVLTDPSSRSIGCLFSKKKQEAIKDLVSADLFNDIGKYPLKDVFILTTEDDAILYKEAKSIHEALQKAGVEHQYHEYQRKSHTLEHVFSVTWPEWEESQEANNDILGFLLG
ncbi:MAG: alpha/beta hydrolase [Bacilli bacterium]|jgi:acetyl esterase/lipase|nr:alpha/beta hydrolase [Bacilli bacterium]